MMVQSYFFVLIYILVLQRHVIYQKPGTFLKTKSRDLNASNGYFSEVLHVFCLAISTKVCGKNLFHFVLIYFISLHRKTKKNISRCRNQVFLYSSWYLLIKERQKIRARLLLFLRKLRDKISEKSNKFSSVGAPSNFHI